MLIKSNFEVIFFWTLYTVPIPIFSEFRTHYGYGYGYIFFVGTGMGMGIPTQKSMGIPGMGMGMGRGIPTPLQYLRLFSSYQKSV